MSDRYDPPDNQPFDPYEGLVDLTGEEPLPPLEDPYLPPATPPRSPLLTGLILGLLLVVLSVAIYKLTRDEGSTTAVAATTIPATATTAGTVESVPATDGTPPSSSTTTTPTTVEFTPYTASGDSIPINELRLAVDAIGPITLGSPADQAIGRLIASLGDPTDDTGPIVSSGEFGGCQDSTVRIVKWGALAAVVVIDKDGTEIFGGYRVDLTYDSAATSDAAELETLSGLKVGFSISQLRSIYSGFQVDIVQDPDVGRIFELRGSSGNLLLWGPVLDTGNEGTDQIMGIYSVDASARFC